MASTTPKVLLVAPPFTPVSQDSVAGIEQMVYLLGKSFHERGIDVTTIAREDSLVHGNLIPGGFANTQGYSGADLEFFHQAMRYTESVVRGKIRSGGIDLIIDKCQGISIPTSIEEGGIPVIGGLDLESKYYIHPSIFTKYLDSIRKGNYHFAAVAQHIADEFVDTHLGKPLEDRMHTIYNGIDVEGFQYSDTKDDYLLFLGRIKEGKAPHLAIKAALESGHRIIVAGGSTQGNPNSQYEDASYIQREISPLMTDQVTWYGPANLRQKTELMKNAKGLLFTSTHREAQPLVPLEAMASGTPVIALRRCKGPEEIIANGKTGYLVDSYEELRNRISSLGEIDPRDCRNHVQENFDYKRMGERTLKLVEYVLGDK